MAELGGGHFAAALERARTGPRAPRDELYAAAVAAKHLRLWERADELPRAHPGERCGDGEAWLERGLVGGLFGLPRARGGGVVRLHQALAHRARTSPSRSPCTAPGSPSRGAIAPPPAVSSTRSRRRSRTSCAPISARASRSSPSGSSRRPALWSAAGDGERAAWAARRAAPRRPRAGSPTSPARRRRKVGSASGSPILRYNRSTLSIPSLLRRWELFAHFTDQQLELLGACVTQSRVPAGASIVREGEPTADAYLIESGGVRIQRQDPLRQLQPRDPRTRRPLRRDQLRRPQRRARATR